ncbi:hypothetical protein [Cytobacillus purgationiresistens]|uniref:Uncharacterized protein n=1 Tax=Cytobacillus purgationiresistens TaxID=863449 RepID=A0ABU0AIY3_9BACI|nr:hypothetical protein [Cytobacillus purgationiresistens]MDQ0270727.1 hypothetical protein [Cytobacillus purgationiresistens]
MSKQAELDELLRKLSLDYGKLNDKQVTFAIKEIGRIRGDISDLLADFATADGTIKRQRLSRLLRELNDIEDLMRKYGTSSIEGIVLESAGFATAGINGAVKTAVGAGAIAGATLERINRNVFDYVMRRYGEDGLVLSDRVWRLSGDMRDELSKVLRADIIRGESVSTMIANIRRVHENETWKIRRLVVTEGNTAYRVGSAHSAKRSDVVQWVKITDNGHRHKGHSTHRCYQLAREDRYGQGAGIYDPMDSEIYSPHPGCSSYITYVLDERYL